ncbi:hypothetical protein HPO96_20095 [Kribbella sandramycini]|uniref:2'-5' RNA ligase n=1 Tax=Kribbella sandramycini TaxID=60450 RepID=A0A7Y4L346_9ACTN|nr:hypothetical protein [Kribbella sandramycini]MBB6564853.1 hypothetical protein [Kribbella sandramycini]NOL42551.1 hypothetical protein [Kribbella sandramycini]
MAGTHARDEPPVAGGRWPLSVVFRPTGQVADLLDALTIQASLLAGRHHWQTGQLGSAHLTVRALEGFRAEVPDDDPAVARYEAAVRRAGQALAASTPFRFAVTGLTLTPGSVMASAFPIGPAADEFMDRLALALGPDDWFERPHGRRDIWYLNLLHFTGDIIDPRGLVKWVGDRRTRDVGELSIAAPELVRFRLVDGVRPAMRPEPVGRYAPISEISSQ